MKGQYIKIVVAASLIMCTMIAGTVSFGFFMEPVTSDLGLERGKFSVYFSLISIVGAITLPFYGRMISRFGTRPPLSHAVFGQALRWPPYLNAIA